MKVDKGLIDSIRFRRVMRKLRDSNALRSVTDGDDAVHVTIVLGALVRFWAYADSHIDDDDTLGMTLDEINELVGINGFAQALPADWLKVLDADHVQLPGFLKHNGSSEKQRRDNARRQAEYRHRRESHNVTRDVTTSNARNDARPEEIRTDKTKEEEPSAAERPSSAGFAKFWESYPKKVKRKDALKAWKSKQLDAKADALVDDVKRRLAEDGRWLGGYVPDPTTYLNGERWNDALEPVAKNGNGQHAADAAAKERTQILDLASMFGMELEGDEEWSSFKARVQRANDRRLASLGRPQ